MLTCVDCMPQQWQSTWTRRVIAIGEGDDIQKTPVESMC